MGDVFALSWVFNQLFVRQAIQSNRGKCVNAVSKILHPKEKLAAMTLDFETDYGNRVAGFNILDESRSQITELASRFNEVGAPVSAFITTSLLDRYPQSGQVVRDLASDFHCHSHTHDTCNFNSEHEIVNTAATFRKHFKNQPLGYRAPQGVLYNNDIELLKQNGFCFSSSVFPSYRPGKFNNLGKPLKPFVYDNGIMELPFAATPKLRTVISLSYMKLFGFKTFLTMFRLFGLPNPIVFDSHLHDFITNPQSFASLPTKIRLAYAIRRDWGLEYYEQFTSFLRSNGYRFVSMSEMYSVMKEQAGGFT